MQRNESLKLVLLDGSLYDPFDQRLFEEAPYFTDLAEVQRWLEENQIQAEVIEA